MLTKSTTQKTPIVMAISLALAAPLALASQTAITLPIDPPPPAPTSTTGTPPKSLAPTAAKPSPDYQSGGVVTVYQLETQDRKNGGFQPGQPIGSFTNAANPWNLGLHKNQPNLAFFQGEPLGYESDAYFVVKEPGTYSFGVELFLPPAEVFTDPDREKGGNRGWIECRYRFNVAGQKLIEIEASTRAKGTHEDARKCGLTGHGFGSIKLDAGLHRTRQWFACTGERRLRTTQRQFAYPVSCPNAGKTFTTDNFPADEAQVTLRVRHPQENTPVLVKTAELVHEKR